MCRHRGKPKAITPQVDTKNIAQENLTATAIFEMSEDQQRTLSVLNRLLNIINNNIQLQRNKWDEKLKHGITRWGE